MPTIVEVLLMVVRLYLTLVMKYLSVSKQIILVIELWILTVFSVFVCDNITHRYVLHLYTVQKKPDDV